MIPTLLIAVGAIAYFGALYAKTSELRGMLVGLGTGLFIAALIVLIHG